MAHSLYLGIVNAFAPGRRLSARRGKMTKNGALWEDILPPGGGPQPWVPAVTLARVPLTKLVRGTAFRLLLPWRWIDIILVLVLPLLTISTQGIPLTRFR